MGRPKGSKNKPKTLPPPIEVSREATIEIPADSDVAQWLFQFCCRHQVSVTVLNGSGHLSNIIPYFQPNFNIPGPLPIMSLSGTVIPTPPQLSGATNSQETMFPLVISLPSSDGVVTGGIVARSATTVGTVKVAVMITTSLSNNVTAPPVSNVSPPQTFMNLLSSDFYDPANTNDMEGTTPVSDAPPLTHMNLMFSELYESINPNDTLEDGLRLYDKLKEKYQVE